MNKTLLKKLELLEYQAIKNSNKERIKEAFSLLESYPEPFKKGVHFGWLKRYQLAYDHILIGRFEYLLRLEDSYKNNELKKFLVTNTIPKVNFNTCYSKKSLVTEMLLDCINNSTTNAFNRQRVLRLFVEWLLYSIGYNGYSSLSSEITQEMSDYWYKNFRIQDMLISPYDYFGDIAVELNIDRHNAFYPTPMQICELMSDICTKEIDNYDNRISTVNDPCVGTGRTLLLASNYHLILTGQDINKQVLDICILNLILYAPHTIYMSQEVQKAIQELKKASH